MSDIRMSLKAQLVHEAPALVGKYWAVTPDLAAAFLDGKGRILCPLALVNQFEQRPATQMHELFPWPWSSMAPKYDPENADGYGALALRQERTAAYYCRPLVALVSPEKNQTAADSYSARLLLLRYNAWKYGRLMMLTAIENLRRYTRSTLSFELPVDLPDEGFIRL